MIKKRASILGVLVIASVLTATGISTGMNVADLHAKAPSAGERAMTIDRMEGTKVIAEASSQRMLEFQRSKLPGGIKEGDILRLVDGVWTIDSNAVKKRKSTIELLMDQLWK